MPIRKDKGRESPAINTSSLPDIVFMLLCFFMVVTKMRDAEIKVKIQVPEATELQKLEQKSLVSHIYIGPPTPSYASVYGTAPQIQLNDAFAKPADIGLFVSNAKTKVDPRQHDQMTAALRIDKDVKMGIVSEVKLRLREHNFRRISYLASQK